LERALAIREKALGPEHPKNRQVASTATRFASCGGSTASWRRSRRDRGGAGSRAETWKRAASRRPGPPRRRPKPATSSDANGQALAYVYYEQEPGRRAAAHLLARDEAWRIAVNIAKLPELLQHG
jgi:hypothetical protein